MRRKTQEEFEKQMKSSRPELDVIGVYEGNTKPITVRCKICGYQWSTSTPANLLTKNTKCKICNPGSNNIKKTTKMFIDEMSKKRTDVKVVGVYNGNKVPIKVACVKCGYTWDTSTPNKLLSGKGRCVRCRKSENASVKQEKNNKLYLDKTEEFIEKAKRIHDNKYDYTKVKYTNGKTHVVIVCKIHGEFNQAPKNHLQGQGCPICGHKRAGISNSLAYSEFIEKISTNIEIDEKGFGDSKKAKCTCKICGYKWESLKNSLTMGHGCPKCSKHYKRTSLEFRSIIKEKQPNIELLENFVDTKTHIKCQCKICGKLWRANPNLLMRGSGCPKCAKNESSNMEQVLLQCIQLLYGEDNVFWRDKSVIGKELDIYVPSEKLAIEPGSWYFHKKRIENDKEKRALCASKGIRLITIYDSYDDDLEELNNISDYITVEKPLIAHRDIFLTIINKLYCVLGKEYVLSSEELDRIYEGVYKSTTKKTAQDFVKEAKRIHGNKYDYSKVQYLDSKKKVCIICPLHGAFWQNYNDHLNGRGCKACGIELTRKSKQKSVKCIETGEMFDSIDDASKKYKITASGISSCIHNKQKSAGGFSWEIIENVD